MDWMYAPQKIKTGKVIKPNSPLEFKIADTRLVYEFALRTNSEELYIINFETLTHRLIAGSNSSFLQLARALQLVHEANSESVTVVDEPVEIDIEFDSIPETTSGVVGEIPTIEQNFLVFSREALVDGIYIYI